MIRMVFFDIDNTLVNHRDAERLAISATHKRFFPDIDSNDFIDTWRKAAKKNWLLFEAGKLSFAKQREQRIIDVGNHYQYTISPIKARQIFTRYLAHYELSWIPFPYTRWFLQKLRKRGKMLGIISNGDLQQQQNKLEKTGLRLFFSPNHTFISGDVGWAKPQREMFAHAQKQSGFREDEICIIGDNVEMDITPAVSMGWHTIHVDHFRMKSVGKDTDTPLTSFLGGLKKIKQKEISSFQHK